MLDKKYLESIIDSTFPDLSNTKIEINSQNVTSFSTSKLLPFLIHQNTIDKNNRVIGMYLPANKNISNLIPFYVAMGQYRKQLNKVMEANNYVSTSYTKDEFPIIYEGNIGYISTVDFITRKLNIRYGRGNETTLPFAKLYKITSKSKNFGKLCERIEGFDRIDKADTQNIFTLPLSPNDHHYEGVIIFTNLTKFEILLQNIKVSGSDLRDHLNIEKVVFPNSGNIKFVRLSNKKTAAKPVSVIVARLDAFRAYSNILESNHDRYHHIKTIIIDDFDNLALKWEQSETSEEELSWLKNNYIQQTKNGQLKDVYLVSRNSNLNIHSLFKKNDVEYHPWLVNPLEARDLDYGANADPEMSILNVGILEFENLNEGINILIKKWKCLAISNYCNGDILAPINALYDLRTKLNSFFNPREIIIFLASFIKTLELLQNQYFPSGLDYSLISETRQLINSNSSNITNYKVDIIIESLKNAGIKKNVMIVSDNKNIDDIASMLEKIRSAHPNINIVHCDSKTSLQINDENINTPEIVFYLTANKTIIGNALGNVLAAVQTFILNNNGYSFASNYAKNYQKLQTELSLSKLQYLLLNIQEPAKDKPDEKSGILQTRYIKKDTILPILNKSEEFVEPELNYLVQEIILSHKGNIPTNSNRYILFFDDGTFELMPENKRIYLYEDDNDIDDIEKSFKAVSELESGNQLMLPKRDKPIKELLENSLKQNEGFSRSIEMDQKWRILINNHLKRSKMDLKFFRKKLNDNAFTIGSDQAVQHWLDGDTRRPDNFSALLKALADMQIIDSDEIFSYDKCNSELKSIQIKFVRTVIRKLILRLNGIDVKLDDYFSDELLNDFINHIELKRISSIHKL